MPRPSSVGVTISAAIALAGSALTVLGGLAFLCMTLFLPRLLQNQPTPPPTPFVTAFLLFDALLFLAFGVWGIASAVGLFELKNWARVSIIVFAAILTFISLPTALIMAIVPLDTANDPDLPRYFFPVFRFLMVSFEGSLAALGIFWLIFFTRPAVRSQFAPPLPTPFAPPPFGDSASLLPPQAAVPFPLPSSSQRLRPLSITVISWILLVGAPFIPLSLLINHALFPKLQSPAPVLGFLLFGRPAFAYFLALAIAQAAAAAAMLKLKPWGLHSTIALQILHLLNTLLVIAIPSNRRRYQEAIEASLSAMNPNLHNSHSSLFIPAWTGFIIGICMVAVYLFFLLRDRQAFLSASRRLSNDRF